MPRDQRTYTEVVKGLNRDPRVARIQREMASEQKDPDTHDKERLNGQKYLRPEPLRDQMTDSKTPDRVDGGIPPTDKAAKTPRRMNALNPMHFHLIPKDEKRTEEPETPAAGAGAPTPSGLSVY